jgi:hypothetical protein
MQWAGGGYAATIVTALSVSEYHVERAKAVKRERCCCRSRRYREAG